MTKGRPKLDVKGDIFRELKKTFNHFFSFVDQKYSINLDAPFKNYSSNELMEIERTFFITQNFQSKNPYVNYLLNVESKKDDLLEGYYEILKWTNSELVLFDVDVKTEHNNIDLGELADYDIKVGDILHLQIDTSNSVWKIAYLELIYPASSKYFLY